jgi:hypothetical protein
VFSIEFLLVKMLMIYENHQGKNEGSKEVPNECYGCLLEEFNSFK